MKELLELAQVSEHEETQAPGFWRCSTFDF